MIFRCLLATFLLAGVLAGTGSGDPKIKPTKEERDAAKTERKAVSVPEPSVLLLTAIGAGSLVAFGYWRDRSSRRSNQ